MGIGDHIKKYFKSESDIEEKHWIRVIIVCVVNKNYVNVLLKRLAPHIEETGCKIYFGKDDEDSRYTDVIIVFSDDEEQYISPLHLNDIVVKLQFFSLDIIKELGLKEPESIGYTLSIRQEEGVPIYLVNSRQGLIKFEYDVRNRIKLYLRNPNMDRRLFHNTSLPEMIKLIKSGEKDTTKTDWLKGYRLVLKEEEAKL